MHEIKLNEKYTLPDGQRYLILKDEDGKLTGTLYEPDDQRILSLAVPGKNFDEVMAIFEKASRAADKIAGFIINKAKSTEKYDNTSAPPFFHVNLTPTDCMVQIKGKTGSIISLLATFLSVNPEYVPVFELALKAHAEHKEEVTIIKTKGAKYHA